MLGGLDLAAKKTNKTGVCLIDNVVELYTVYEDEEIIEILEGAEMIAIDAPLTEKKVAFREAERELMKVHGPLLPLNMKGMRRLAGRGRRLRDMMDGEFIETFPRAVEKNLKIERDELKIEFRNEHEYDAYLCALTAESYNRRETKSYGEEELIIVPSKD